MSTIRVLPLGVPVAAGISTTGEGAVVVLAVIGLLLTLLMLRSTRLRGGDSEDGGDVGGSDQRA